jgi:hypothetical protein
MKRRMKGFLPWASRATVMTEGGCASVSSTSIRLAIAGERGEGFPVVRFSRIEVVGACSARHQLGGARGMVK